MNAPSKSQLQENHGYRVPRIRLFGVTQTADAGVAVLDYVDHAVGIMEESSDGSGQFVSVTLRPRISIAAGCDADKALALHVAAHSKCYIARSVHFPVNCEASITRFMATGATAS